MCPLGQRAGARSPPAFLVNVPDGFADLVSDAEAKRRFQQVGGPYFGSGYITANSTVVASRRVSDGKLEAAGGIFAFDCLVQNPDRREAKPNLLEHSDGYHPIDHDMALAFFGGLLIGGPVKPWDKAVDALPTFEFLERHLFANGLKGKERILDRFRDRLATLECEQIRAILDTVPSSWWPDGDLRDSIETYLNEAVSQRDTLVAFARHFLRP